MKMTPVRPFPEITDSEETQLSVSSPDRASTSRESKSSPIKIPVPNLPAAKIILQDVSVTGGFKFATPSPPRKKLALAKSPVTPKITPVEHSPAESPVTPKITPAKRSPATTSPKSPGKRQPKTPRSAKKNMKGETLLHIAAMKGNVDDVKALLQEGADVNAKDNAGWTPLHEACNFGLIEIVCLLLDAGALINVPGYEDETPLMDASRQGYPDIVKMLLDRGADMNLRSSYGLTASDLTTNHEIGKILEEHLALTQASINFDETSFMKSAPNNIVINYSSMLNADKVKECSKVLSATINTKDMTATTHYIVPKYEDEKSPRTLKYLQAVARGIWIVRNEWLEACMQAGTWVRENDFEILGSREDLIDGGPKRSRINKAAKCPAIFHGCHFYLQGFFKPLALSKPILSEILQLAGGTMLSREPKPDSDSVQTCTKVPYHAHKDSAQYFHTYYIVYDNLNGTRARRVRQGKVCTVPYTWVLDCISQFYLCEIPES